MDIVIFWLPQYESKSCDPRAPIVPLEADYFVSIGYFLPQRPLSILTPSVIHYCASDCIDHSQASDETPIEYFHGNPLYRLSWFNWYRIFKSYKTLVSGFIRVYEAGKA